MITTSRLECGVTLVTEQMSGVRSACVGFWVGTGSRDESDAEAGISHFLEHLLFKGTPGRSARSIAEDIDAVGGDMNAFTTKEYTTFYVRTLAEDLDLGLDILADIITDPALRTDEVDAERQVILEEFAMHLDEPADVVQERLFESLFPGHPLGRDVLGREEVIENIGVPAIRTFMGEHYRPGNIVVAAAGDIDHEALCAGIAERFSGTSAGDTPTRVGPEARLVPVHVTSRDSEQAQIAIGMRAPDRHSKKRYPLALLNHTLGGGLSSRLFQKIREEKGLAYSVSSDRVSFDDAGALVVAVGCSPDRVEEVLELVNIELEDLVTNGVSDRELELAKGHVRADTLLSLEDSGSRMSRIGASALLHGEVLPIEELTRRIEVVTRDDVAQIAAEVLGAERALAIVGPFEPDQFGD
jgi:predicted Zn-dependent peptidase